MYIAGERIIGHGETEFTLKPNANFTISCQSQKYKIEWKRDKVIISYAQNTAKVEQFFVKFTFTCFGAGREYVYLNYSTNT